MLPARFTYPSPGFSHYWNYGAGKKMLKQLDHIPQKESIEEYAKTLMEYDKTGDNVIAEVFDALGFHKANELVNNILDQGINNVNDVPESLKELFAEVDTVPEWLNWDLLETGSAFCQRTGVFALIVLRNYCLMGGYESSAINKPLIYTGALKKGAAKRITETMEFWVNATGKGAMKQGAIGFKHTIKVRLMHAFARHSILKSTDWDNDMWGAPINQCDMVATNLGFSIVFMEGLKRVGFKPTEEEVKGLLHLWKYIGYVLGIPPSYLPDTEKQAIESLYKWTMFQSPADEDTKALAFALMNEPILSNFPTHKWQKKLLIKLHLAYNYFFLDDRACQTMGLPKSKIWYLPYLAWLMNRSKEYVVMANKSLFNYSVRAGRKDHENVKRMYLRGQVPTVH
ncbi:MAG TPA: oxygenase MpaB family protein [Bacteroidia bacterium]|nr:oxygenase MpaB family protein [Bacteroidia bacterium]